MSFDDGFLLGLSMSGNIDDDEEDEHDGDWQKWLDLPEPNANQAVFLVRATTDQYYVAAGVGRDDGLEGHAVGYTIDWGDGTITDTTNGEPGTDASFDTHIYSECGEYVVIFTTPDIHNIGVRLSTEYIEYGETVDKGARLIMAKYGDNVFPDSSKYGMNYATLKDQFCLRYVRLSPFTEFFHRQDPPTPITEFFSGCERLRKIEYNGFIPLNDRMFYLCRILDFNSFAINENSESVPISCFAGCNFLKRISLKKCKSVAREAFKGCQFLSKVLLPECTMIEKSAFYGCQSLSKIELPECITIAEQAFRSCIALKNFSFPKCTSIGARAFDSCKSLSRVYVPDCKSIGLGAFGNTGNISVFEASNDCIYGSSNFSVLDPIYPTPDGQV